MTTTTPDVDLKPAATDRELPGMPPPAKDPDPITKRPHIGRPPGAKNKPKPDAAAVAPKGTGRPSKDQLLANALERQYELLGKMIGSFAPLAGQAIREEAASCADALSMWAASSPRVRARLEATMTATGVFGVIAAHAPIGAAIVIEIKLRQAGQPPLEIPEGMTFAGMAANLGESISFEVPSP